MEYIFESKSFIDPKESYVCVCVPEFYEEKHKPSEFHVKEVHHSLLDGVLGFIHLDTLMLTMLAGTSKSQGKADEARRSCRSSRFIDKVYVLGHFPKPEGRRAADVVHHRDFALSKGIATAKARYLR